VGIRLNIKPQNYDYYITVMGLYVFCWCADQQHVQSLLYWHRSLDNIQSQYIELKSEIQSQHVIMVALGKAGIGTDEKQHSIIACQSIGRELDILTIRGPRTSPTWRLQCTGISEQSQVNLAVILGNINRSFNCAAPAVVLGATMAENTAHLRSLVASVGTLSLRRINQAAEEGQSDALSLFSNCIVSVNLAGNLASDISSITGDADRTEDSSDNPAAASVELFAEQLCGMDKMRQSVSAAMSNGSEDLILHVVEDASRASLVGQVVLRASGASASQPPPPPS
jgi:hypothetical protein